MCDGVSAKSRSDQPTHEGGARAQTDIYTDVCCGRYSKILASSQALRSSCLKPAALAAIHSTLIPSISVRTHTHTYGKNKENSIAGAL